MSPRSPALVLALVLLACGRPSPGDEASETSGSSGEGTFGMGATSITSTDPTAPPDPSLPTSDPAGSDPSVPQPDPDPSVPTISDTATEPTIGPDTDFTTTLQTSTTFDSDTATTGTTTTGEICSDLPGQPQDANCTDASGCGCASGRCFIMPILGGLCGECLGDSDCGGGGCTVPNPIVGLGAKCNKGQPGDGCMSDGVCAAPGAGKCGQVFAVPGIVTVTTCGECASNADCGADAPNCSPDYALLGFGGTLVCAADGSRADDTGCDLASDGAGGALGDDACQSGHCGAALLQGVVELGLCGQCSDDADCSMDQVCGEARADLTTGALFGARCVPPTCENAMQDGQETGVDCGGPCLPCVP